MRLPLLAAALSMALGAVAAPIDTLARMRETGVATMGVREASGALSYRVGENAFAGFHVELCQRVLGDVRQKLGLPRLDIAYRPVSSQNRIPLLLNGSIDIECGSTTNTTQRQLDVAFAPTTFVEETRFAVKADSGIGSLAQIDGKRVSTNSCMLPAPVSMAIPRRCQSGNRTSAYHFHLMPLPRPVMKRMPHCTAGYMVFPPLACASSMSLVSDRILMDLMRQRSPSSSAAFCAISHHRSTVMASKVATSPTWPTQFKQWCWRPIRKSRSAMAKGSM